MKSKEHTTHQSLHSTSHGDHSLWLLLIPVRMRCFDVHLYQSLQRALEIHESVCLICAVRQIKILFYEYSFKTSSQGLNLDLDHFIV